MDPLLDTKDSERDLAILSRTLLIQHSWGTKPSHNDLTAVEQFRCGPSSD